MKKLLNKKGMTLVEVIVVLVILAILAAVLVPSMVGWIDKAKEKTVLAEARAVYLAAQTIASEEYAKPTPVAPAPADVKELAGVEGTVSGIEVVAGEVTAIIYASGDTTVKFTKAAGWVKQ